MKTQKHQENIMKVLGFVKDNAPTLPYHNAYHAIEVWNTARQYALMGDMNINNKQALEVAALLHDIIVVPGRADNEQRSADFAKFYTGYLGYNPQQTETTKRIILATKMPQNPQDYLEELICDSDLDNLGRNDFFLKGDFLRQELGLPDNIEWYQRQLDFIKNHNYFTEVARNFRNPGKLKNIENLNYLINLQKQIEDKKRNIQEELTSVF